MAVPEMKKRKRKAIGEYIKTSARIGFHEWSLEDYRAVFDKAVMEALKEALELATEDYKVEAYFPTDALKGDPATIFVELPIGPAEFENPIWKFELVDLITDLIDTFDADGALPLDDVDKPMFIALRDRLHQLADMLDEVIHKD